MVRHHLDPSAICIHQVIPSFLLFSGDEDPSLQLDTENHQTSRCNQSYRHMHHQNSRSHVVEGPCLCQKTHASMERCSHLFSERTRKRSETTPELLHPHLSHILRLFRPRGYHLRGWLQKKWLQPWTHLHLLPSGYLPPRKGLWKQHRTKTRVAGLIKKSFLK